MRQGSREAVDPHDDQRVAFADAFQHPRKHRSRTIAARGLLFVDLDAARRFQGPRLGQGGLILGRGPSVTYQGHQNSLFAVSYIAIRRPIESDERRGRVMAVRRARSASIDQNSELAYIANIGDLTHGDTQRCPNRNSGPSGSSTGGVRALSECE